MLSAIEHIAQNYPKPVYSEIFYLESNATTGIVEKNFDQENARAIYTLYLYWTPKLIENPGTPATPGYTLITFSDQYNQVLFRSLSNGTAWAPIFRVLKGQQLKIQSNPVSQFQVSYQYIL